MKSLFIKRSFLLCAILCLITAGCKVTFGGCAIVVMAVGLIQIFQKKYGRAAVCYLFVMLLQIMTPILVGGSLANIAGKMTIAFFAIAGLMSARRGKSSCAPALGLLFAYAAYMVIPSSFGWFPLISYLKIVAFICMLVSLALLCRGLAITAEDVLWTRSGAMAVCAFIVWGSIAAWFFPAVGYSMQINKLAVWQRYVTGSDIASGAVGGVSLFSGVLMHSQVLSTILVAVFAWLVCDMFFAERRIGWFHSLIIAPVPVLIYMTRSRTGLFAFAITSLFILIYSLRHALVPRRVKSAVALSSFVVVLLMCAYVGVQQARNGLLEKWLLKSSGEGDLTVENVASSRMGKIDENMYDFHQNPLIGKGFQTSEDHRYLYQVGAISIFSAPVEKSVTPLMVLGEGGVVGGLIFIAFLICFVRHAIKNKNMSTLSLFVAFFLVNLGEASIFSPSGQGGVLWALVLLGGVATDSMVKLQNEQEMFWGRL